MICIDGTPMYSERLDKFNKTVELYDNTRTHSYEDPFYTTDVVTMKTLSDILNRDYRLDINLDKYLEYNKCDSSQKKEVLEFLFSLCSVDGVFSMVAANALHNIDNGSAVAERLKYKFNVGAVILSDDGKYYLWMDTDGSYYTIYGRSDTPTINKEYLS